MTEAEREKIKLRANYCNGAALILLGVGGIAPMVAAYSAFPAGEWFRLVWGFIVAVPAVGTSFSLHKHALVVLQELDG